MRAEWGLLFAVVAGCAGAPKLSEVVSAEAQGAMTGDEAERRLEEGNARFVSGHMLARDLGAQVRASAGGQHPFAAVLSCVDSRIPVEEVFDQGIGDVFAARVAGNFATPEILGSLEFATQVSGAKLLVVMGHTHCGAVKAACDHVDAGNIAALVTKIRPSVDAIAGPTCTSKDLPLVDRIAEDNVARTIREIREKSPAIAELESTGKLKIVAAMYDLDTGHVTFEGLASAAGQK